ncbi:hypothetical protein SAMN03159341_1534 [Paenibacillus sp. 1_12]|uniref:hypothetical protein n=1 Tax=Paenibacillus sp. 1_12 TaxID=1566278 RepID=UPI0008F25E4A|nr:hypothetical protein [Paenibacillus sp. 1_12]SFM56349.1 hypothetical protein SAMN03159341_1534 [Paenibacillus sp. 1_12]
MRIATGIISLFLMFIVGLQSCAVSIGGALSGDTDTSSVGSIGIFVAFLYLLGGAFAFKLPRISVWIFIIAGILGFIAPSNAFKDMPIWGGVSIALAIMSYFGGKRKKIKVDNEKLAPGEYRIKPGGKEL